MTRNSFRSCLHSLRAFLTHFVQSLLLYTLLLLLVVQRQERGEQRTANASVHSPVPEALKVKSKWRKRDREIGEGMKKKGREEGRRGKGRERRKRKKERKGWRREKREVEEERRGKEEGKQGSKWKE